ncbi:Protein PIN-LIKES 1 isoform B [Glycine soja]|uniref:Protein PIN-LIKES 1 isoform B n=1 Tax=Glycine soja TaxID=3848 RepID=A0A445J396_GLYSO|nr:Protein PIN-LIKES 1 isoform B [Glycine soja]
MGFIKLFSVASFPVIKVLLITALGLFLALDNISILGEDARKKVNQLVFYVFNPSLVGSNLAKTITFESVVKLWFMPVNILGTFILGSALGWILIKMTRPPKRMEGLILGCCSAGNLGNLPMIIIAAICKQEGSPFGEPDLCNQYGMAYAALSMAIGAVFLWSYVYNLMRISSSRIQNEDRTSNDSSMLKASKGTVDNAYTILLPETNSEEKIAGFIIGVVPQIRNFMIGNNAPLHVVEDSASMLGEAAIPTVTLIMGANLLKGLKGTTAPVWTIVGIVVVRYIFLPLLGIAVVKGAMHLSLVHSDALYQFVLLLQYALPPAMNIGTIAQLFGSGESECSVIMLWTYALASIAVTLWSTFFMWLVS